MNFLSNHKLVQVSAATAAGTTAVSGTAIDMDGFETVTFFCTIATANAGNYIKVQTDSASGFSSGTDVTGSTVVAGADGDIVAVELTQPVERYVRPQVVRGASTAAGEIWAVLSNPRTLPVDNDVTGVIVSAIVQP